VDEIVKSYLNGFVEKMGLPNDKDESELFEYFSTYSILSHEVNNIITNSALFEMSTGKSKGIDAIAFSINNELITNSEKIDTYGKMSITVDVYFFQAKTSNSFDDSELGNFMDAVIDFLSENQQYNLERMKLSKEIYEKFKTKYRQIEDFRLHCFYVYLGDKQGQGTTLQVTKEKKETILKNLNIFSKIKIDFVDQSTLFTKYKKAINPIEASFQCDNKTPLKNIKNVAEAYIGFLPFSEFKNLIIDDKRDEIKNLFNDNLRDFLGLENSVNDGIKRTIEEGKFTEFSLLNNGITVLADENKGKGNTLILKNYQIVNGCQTSNVLYECRNKIGINDTLIPLKVVITTDSDLRDSIILSTNSQSKFAEEQMSAITKFQETLEDYYRSQKDKDNLYYERRTNQYHSIGINRNDIVEIKEQIKSFMAMFFDMPYIVVGNIGKIIKKHKNKFFTKEHEPLPYYIAGLISKKWDNIFFDGSIYQEFNKYRYHIFMGFRIIVEDITFDEEFLKNPKKYSIKLPNGEKNICYEKLLNNLRNIDEFKKNIDIVISILKLSDYKKYKGVYSQKITDDFVKNLKEYKELKSI
jgi:hypothetical protein